MIEVITHDNDGETHPKWTIQGAELDEKVKLPIKNVEELIELYNEVMQRLGEEGILNVGSR